MSGRPEGGRRQTNSRDKGRLERQIAKVSGERFRHKERERHGAGASIELRTSKTVLLAATYHATGERGRVRAQVEIAAGNPATRILGLGAPRKTRLSSVGVRYAKR